MRDKRRTQTDERLADLATRQHGVVSIRQLEHLGYTRSAVSRGVRTGRLHRLHRGVYAVGHRRLTWHGRCLAAVLANSPAVASHFTAAWLWGLLQTRPSGAFHLTAPSRRRAKPEFEVHFAQLDKRDRQLVAGIPVTSLSRTLLDLATTLSADGLGRLLERAEERGLFDLAAIDELLSRTTGHSGRGRLRAALAAYRPDPEFTRSRLERRFLDLVKRAGLPTPSMNFNFAGYELDAFWGAERFVVELDVFETHGTRAAFERDRRRQEELKLLGIEMIRVTGPRLKREPAATMERVRVLLARRREELARLGGLGARDETR